MLRSGLLFVALTGLAACAGSQYGPADVMPVDAGTLSGGRPIVIAHRGASGLRPEHTLAAYALAIEQGADVIEPDLVMTGDGVLVDRHDRYLSTTTDVAEHPEFAERRRVDPAGSDRTDWWVEDFTLDELKTLRAVQPFPGRSTEFDGLYEIPTFDEVIDLAKARSAELGRTVALYPETKSPGYFALIGLDMEAPLLAALEREGWTGPDAPVYIQSFEPEILISLNEQIDAPLVMLVSPTATGVASSGAPTPNIPLEEAAAFADGVGPEKTLVMTSTGEDTGFVAAAHALGLLVHPWTFRDDNVRDGFDSAADEIARAFEIGVDGVFTDFPATGVAVRDGEAM
ncbi:MAG: glycerophosphodiester phosphodiesterase family protein [Maricaulaceae bacterium]|jgi:glycerophosphoryl diester phosphodiesterase